MCLPSVQMEKLVWIFAEGGSEFWLKSETLVSYSEVLDFPFYHNYKKYDWWQIEQHR